MVGCSVALLTTALSQFYIKAFSDSGDVILAPNGSRITYPTNQFRNSPFEGEQTMPEVAIPNHGEREFETGTDESFKNANATGGAAHNENQRVTYANIKRTYDVYQDLDIQAARQSLIEQTRLNQIASQALQNAVESANMVGKQAIRHADIAADALWTDELNPVMRASGANLAAGAVPANRAIDVSAAGVSVDAHAVAAAVAKQVDATITPVLATLQQIVQALATATTAIGNVVNQTQPKTTA